MCKIWLACNKLINVSKSALGSIEKAEYPSPLPVFDVGGELGVVEFDFTAEVTAAF